MNEVSNEVSVEENTKQGQSSYLDYDEMLGTNQLNVENQQYIEKNILELNKDNLSNIQYDKDSFLVGIKEMSVLAGKITALVNVGITPPMALGYIYDNDINNATLNSAEKIADTNLQANLNTIKLDILTPSKNVI